MPTRLVVLVAGASALVGGLLAALLVGVVGGGETTTTVVAPASTATPASTAPPAAIPRGTFDPAAVYRSRAGGVVTIYAVFETGSRSQGSGFVVDGEGTILTNAHVITDAGSGVAGDVTGASDVYVVYRDRERVPAKIVGWDLFNDVGVIDVDPADHQVTPVPLGDSDGIVVGMPVAAIGSPFDNQSSLSVGVVSATGRSIDSLTSGYRVADAIQIDAPINRGNSGGPLFDARGSVIGINAQIRSESGNNEGVGFAIPIGTARRAMEQLLATGKVEYAYIGIKSEDVTPGIARRYDLPASTGALIVGVEPGTPAERAGLRPGNRSVSYNGLTLVLGGDLVVAIDGKPVRSADDVSRIVTEELRPGETVPFTVYRGSERKTVQVELGTRPATP